MRIFATAPVAGLAALLVACQPQAPDGSSAQAPADAPPPAASTAAAVPEPFQGEMLARGTEPFWMVRIQPDTLTLERPDFETVTAPNPGAVMEGEAAVWRAVAADGRPLPVTLRPGECSAGMSDLRYDYVAAASLAGAALRGCAGKADAMPREGA